MKTAILVIDIQCALTDPEPRPDDIDAVINRINLITGKARKAELPVFFIQHEAPDSPVAYGSPGWRLPEKLAVEDGDRFIRKTTPDSFLKTDLHDQLQALGIKQLVICGYASEFCVDTTTRRAAGLGYAIKLVTDGHTTHDKPHAAATEIRAHHNATLTVIQSFSVPIKGIAAADLQFTG
ncbi:cysteine hydrolase family protein [Aestuariispira insulae]|uniref:Nicotinamidase-related amidase n=1 Tax=Aestuariispira insulae TaxID=1461337 RepID=A0A3D9HEG4_9PROT|nr:cysteine hydrolase family protein [Aestuariispira insulae]RED47641.1 nicotinamidase-related amidase [Aestuariispira insulae]